MLRTEGVWRQPGLAAVGGKDKGGNPGSPGGLNPLALGGTTVGAIAHIARPAGRSAGSHDGVAADADGEGNGLARRHDAVRVQLNSDGIGRQQGKQLPLFLDGPAGVSGTLAGRHFEALGQPVLTYLAVSRFPQRLHRHRPETVQHVGKREFPRREQGLDSTFEGIPNGADAQAQRGDWTPPLRKLLDDQLGAILQPDA